MARKPEPTKPVYPLIYEYEASMKHVLHEAGMLLQVVKFIAETPEIAPKLQDNLKERYNALSQAMYGDERSSV